MMEYPNKILETDVLIIGSEAAGARAAIEASKHGLDVSIITKGRSTAVVPKNYWDCQATREIAPSYILKIS
jgi:thioredoxin reductase